MKGKFILNTLKPSDKKEGITLVVTCSKIQLLPFLFESLKRMDLPREDMHLLVYDNTSDINYLEALEKEIDNFLCPKCRQFRSIRIYKSFLKPKGVVTGSGNESFHASPLWNIWNMWKRIYHMIYTETFFQLEDDTIAPTDTFRRLYGLLMKNSKVGFVTAIETGRNSLPYLPVRIGVHKVDIRKGFLWKRESFPPSTKGVHEIDASGVYCFVARTEAYKSAFEGYKPVADIFSLFALDNVLTYNIKKHGWKILADFGCTCGHLQVSMGRICIFTPEQALHFVDVWLPEYNNYAIALEIKKPGQKRRVFRIRKPAPCFELHPDKDFIALEDIKKIKKEIRKRKKKP